MLESASIQPPFDREGEPFLDRPVYTETAHKLGAALAKGLTGGSVGAPTPGNYPPPQLSEAEQRKQRPLARGVLDYFPDALMEVAHVSFIGNEQHNPGQELHWAKEKSTDDADALLRHLKDRGTRDSDGERHSAKVAWRALAMLQREIEAEGGLRL